VTAPFQVACRPLDWDLSTADALRLVRHDPHPVAPLGAWADGSDIVASESILTPHGSAIIGNFFPAIRRKHLARTIACASKLSYDRLTPSKDARHVPQSVSASTTGEITK
jgi:hypothetical protein